MRAKRILANLRVADVEATKSFYTDYLGLTTEPWGVRRFLVRATDGNVINVVNHGTDIAAASVFAGEPLPRGLAGHPECSANSSVSSPCRTCRDAIVVPDSEVAGPHHGWSASGGPGVADMSVPVASELGNAAPSIATRYEDVSEVVDDERRP